MDLANIKQSYSAAVDSFIEKLKDDPNVIAAILCGSLSYDEVWEKSDIDMTLIVRDQKLTNRGYCVIEDGIIINVDLMERSNFRRIMEWSTGGSFLHSLFAKGKIIYSKDESLYSYFEDIKKLGRDDIEITLFHMANELISYLHKSEKWQRVKNDTKYSQYYVLKAAGVVASMEVVSKGETPTREAILRAREISPELMKILYDDPLSKSLSREQLMMVLNKIDEYLLGHIDAISSPVIQFMSDGEVKTLSVLAQHFNMEPHFIVGIFDYLSEKGILERLSETMRITPKSKLAVEEVAYVYVGNMFSI